MSTNNLNLQEIEIRATLTVDQYQSIKSKLIELDAVIVKTEYIKDDYWCKSSARSFEDIKMDAVGTYSLRTRYRKSGDKEKSDLNIKVITTESDHNAWDEHEVVVDNYTSVTNILKALSHKVFFRLEKDRETYEAKGFTIVLENIKDYGYVMEVEKMGLAEDSERIKGEIKSFMTEVLGIVDSQILAKTINYILMQEKSVF